MPSSLYAVVASADASRTSGNAARRGGPHDAIHFYVAHPGCANFLFTRGSPTRRLWFPIARGTSAPATDGHPTGFQTQSERLFRTSPRRPDNDECDPGTSEIRGSVNPGKSLIEDSVMSQWQR